MSSTYDSNFSFNNMARIGSDSVDSSQKNLTNTRFSSYILENYYTNGNSMDTQVQFASAQPTMTTTGLSSGGGLSGNVIDQDSELMLNTEQQRSYAKLGLVQRPFLTVPYLGRGSCDPVMESKLQQGELELLKKSTGNMTEVSVIDYESYPIMDSIKRSVTNPKYLVEESAMDGWIRGGIDTRDAENNSAFNKSYRPNNKL